MAQTPKSITLESIDLGVQFLSIVCICKYYDLYACICIYMHVYACICMYMYALYVYVCIFMYMHVMHVYACIMVYWYLYCYTSLKGPCFAVSLGCIHDEVRSEPGSWLVVGMIPVFDKKKAIRTKLRTEDGPMGASRRRIQITHQCIQALLEGWNTLTHIWGFAPFGYLWIWLDIPGYRWI